MAQIGFGFASMPAQPALDGSVPCSSLDCGHAEAQDVVPVLRRVPVAVRRAALPGEVAPATAPENPERGPGRARCIGGRRRGVVFPIISIGAPFPNIAQHIIQSPGSRALLAYRVSLAVTVVAKPDMLAALANVIAPREQAGHPRTACVFPLRLR